MCGSRGVDFLNFIFFGIFGPTYKTLEVAWPLHSYFYYPRKVFEKMTLFKVKRIGQNTN